MKSWLLWVAVAIVFCSPFNIGWTDGLPMLHFDHEGMLWLVGMSEYIQRSEIMISGWPLGQSNTHLDSLLLLWTAKITSAGNHPYLFMYLVTILGLSLSAWSAQRLSQELAPESTRWSWAAGMLYGFQALYTVSILEGHVYLLWTFWLPLGWWGLHRLLNENHITHILWVVGCWIAALLTSAYVGLCATLLYTLYGVWHWRKLHRGFIASTVALLTVGSIYAWRLFSANLNDNQMSEAREPTSALQELQAGSSTLSNLVVWDPSVDMVQHSLAPTLGWLPLCMMLFAPWVLSRRQWAFNITLSAMALLLSFGPTLSITPEHTLFPSPLYPLFNNSVGFFIHFPARFLYLSVLGMALLIPSLLHTLYHWAPRRTWMIAAVCILEPTFIYGLPFRQGLSPIQHPSVYDSTAEGLAILELIPRFDDSHLLEALRLKNKICAYQIHHRRTLINECLGKNPMGKMEEHLRESLLDPRQSTDWTRPLMELGVGTVVLHADLWPPRKRTEILEHLSASLGEANEHIDGGEHLIVWTLPTTPQDINIQGVLEQLQIQGR
jgi:hypothetical protein